jgi:hypothetical protein
MKKQTNNTVNGGSSPASRSASLALETKLFMLDLPIRRAVQRLRWAADHLQNELGDDESCNFANIATWLEGVMQETPAYAGPTHVADAEKKMAKLASKKRTFIFFRADGFYPLEIPEATVADNAECNPGTIRVEDALTGEILWQNAELSRGDGTATPQTLKGN